ncbi:hypothetical protein K9K77_02685 [Candidatus Babeliales bacterium]|nr:hypothetical protein [Candidatus Babeliales bacterium]
MDAMCKAKIGKALWFVTGLTALSVGLGAVGVNVLGMLHMESLQTVLRYFVGVAGLASIVMFFMECARGKC